MDAADKAKYVIENNIFMTIATADGAGKPWVSPVGFVYDDNYNLYWVSNKEALHSVNIRVRATVAIVLFGKMPEGNFDGVYIDATATELNDEAEIQAGIDLFKARRPQPGKFETKSIADVSGQAAWRMYKATPIEISKRSETTLHGQTITVRETVTL